MVPISWLQLDGAQLLLFIRYIQGHIVKHSYLMVILNIFGSVVKEHIAMSTSLLLLLLYNEGQSVVNL